MRLEQRRPREADARTAEPPGELMAALQDVALLGDRFDRVEVAAATGQDADAADRLLAEAVQRGVLEHGSDGYRFADPATAQRLVGQVPAARRRTVLEQVGGATHRGGRSPGAGRRPAPGGGRAGSRGPVRRRGRSGGRPGRAARRRAPLDRRGAAARVRDRPRCRPLAARGLPRGRGGPRRGRGLPARTGRRGPRSRRQGCARRMARAAVLAGDLGSAEEALAGLEPTGGPDDADILLARGMVLYHSDDLDAAEAALEAARPMALAPGAPDRLLSVITLQGMIAHNRGQWSDRLRRELRATSENPGLAATVFDSHLCVAEYLLYGPTPYDEVVALADGLREQAERAGARRGRRLRGRRWPGEAALLAGDLDLARTRLAEAVDLHVALGADTGTAHTLQRLAEVELAAGDRVAAERPARPGAGPGPLVAALPAPAAAGLRHLDRGGAGPEGRAGGRGRGGGGHGRAGVLPLLPGHDRRAGRRGVHRGRSAGRGARLAGPCRAVRGGWQGTAWQGAVAEARAHLARAEGDQDGGGRLFASAADLFELAGQPIDAQRCGEALHRLSGCRTGAPARWPGAARPRPSPASRQRSGRTGPPTTRPPSRRCRPGRRRRRAAGRCPPPRNRSGSPAAG